MLKVYSYILVHFYLILYNYYYYFTTYAITITMYLVVFKIIDFCFIFIILTNLDGFYLSVKSHQCEVNFNKIVSLLYLYIWVTLN